MYMCASFPGPDSQQVEVGFTAHYENVCHLFKDQVHKFDGVDTNVGNGYDRHSGLFTAPVSGTYLFTWVMTVQAGYTAITVLNVNGNGRSAAKACSPSHSAVKTGTNTLVISLQKGDKVWLAARSEWHLHTTYFTFPGLLLFS